MNNDLQTALLRYLLSIADDEIVLGYRDSEWTGIAPMVEEDIAFSSLAQDEIGHARLYYTLAGELTGNDADTLALGRDKHDYYHARLLEHRTTPKYQQSGVHESGGDWAFTVVRRFLYDLFDDLRTEALSRSGYTPLANAVKKIRREEHYHLKHGALWWQMLARSDGSRARLEVALERLWPDLLGLFEEAPGEALLEAEGVLPVRTGALQDGWLERLGLHLSRYALSLPQTDASLGGRRGEHGAAWDELFEEMTMVRRLEPEGTW